MAGQSLAAFGPGIKEPMLSISSQALVRGGALTAAAAVAHLACIALGAPAYRFMGAGERMASAVDAGKMRPTLITAGISAILLLWAMYAVSVAGVIRPLPFPLRLACDQFRVPGSGCRRDRCMGAVASPNPSRGCHAHAVQRLLRQLSKLAAKIQMSARCGPVLFR
ncbi:MAG TPA: hypothetical protein VFL86_20850, partial [Burkholderiaceae bacterium]|nr:hypothetical protein [Burkholderiaceae bacterium]